MANSPGEQSLYTMRDARKSDVHAMAAIEVESNATWRESARTLGSRRLTSSTAFESTDSASWTWIHVSSMPSLNGAFAAGSIVVGFDFDAVGHYLGAGVIAVA